MTRWFIKNTRSFKFLAYHLFTTVLTMHLTKSSATVHQGISNCDEDSNLLFKNLPTCFVHSFNAPGKKKLHSVFTSET